jgi:hypothetical protein
MKSGRVVLLISIFFMATVVVFAYSLRNAEAGRGGRGVGGPRGGAVGGPGVNVPAQTPRGNVAVGTRFNSLPVSAKARIVGGVTYYVDDDDVYYLPCEDDPTVYCVVEPPE